MVTIDRSWRLEEMALDTGLKSFLDKFQQELYAKLDSMKPFEFFRHLKYCKEGAEKKAVLDYLDSITLERAEEIVRYAEHLGFDVSREY